jgi:hypothetical protein
MTKTRRLRASWRSACSRVATIRTGHAQVVAGQSVDKDGAPQLPRRSVLAQAAPQQVEHAAGDGTSVDQDDHVWFLNRNQAPSQSK